MSLWLGDLVYLLAYQMKRIVNSLFYHFPYVIRVTSNLLCMLSPFACQLFSSVGLVGALVTVKKTSFMCRVKIRSLHNNISCYLIR